MDFDGNTYVTGLNQITLNLKWLRKNMKAVILKAISAETESFKVKSVKTAPTELQAELSK